MIKNGWLKKSAHKYLSGKTIFALYSLPFFIHATEKHMFLLVGAFDYCCPFPFQLSSIHFSIINICNSLANQAARTLRQLFHFLLRLLMWASERRTIYVWTYFLCYFFFPHLKPLDFWWLVSICTICSPNVANVSHGKWANLTSLRVRVKSIAWINDEYETE